LDLDPAAEGAGPSAYPKTRAKVLPLWETEARSGPKMEARAHLLEEAAIAFMERGFAATTLAYVAQRMGTTKGQIYHYYRSKSDLYFDVVVGAYFVVNDKTEQLAARTDLSPAERLHYMAVAHAQVIMKTWAWQRVALEATQHQLLVGFTPREGRALARITEFRDDYENRLSMIIAEGMEKGQFSPAPLVFATKAALGSLNWLTVWYDPRKSSGSEAQDSIAHRIADFIIAGLSSSNLSFRDTARAALGLPGLQQPNGP